MKRLFLFVALLVMVCSVSAFAGANALVDEKCGSCHDTARVYAKKTDKAGWDAIVDRMVKRGLKISPEDMQKVKDYLYTLK